MILVVNLKNRRRGGRRRKRYMLDLVLLNVQFLFYPLQLGLCVCEGESEEGLFHFSHDMFFLGL